MAEFNFEMLVLIASPPPLSTNFPSGKFAERGKIDLLRRSDSLLSIVEIVIERSE